MRCGSIATDKCCLHYNFQKESVHADRYVPGEDYSFLFDVRGAHVVARSVITIL